MSAEYRYRFEADWILKLLQHPIVSRHLDQLLSFYDLDDDSECFFEVILNFTMNLSILARSLLKFQ